MVNFFLYLKMKKKAILGLDTAKLFVLAILVIVIVSVVTLIILDSIGDIQPNAYGSSLSNTTTSTVVNYSSSAYPTGLSSANLDCVLTVGVMTNATSGDIIPSTNYTITDCSISCIPGACPAFNNSLWNVTGAYTQSSASKNIVYNTSNSLSEFFEDSGTWFTLIGVVIIILIIAVVIVVVNRFSGEGAFSRTSQAPNI